MTAATSAKFEELILEVEFDPSGAAGTYTAICGLIDVTVNRTSNVDTSEIPDCDDESLPLSIERQVRSQEVTASGSGIWALQSNQKLMAWWRSATTLNARLRNAKAIADGASGDTTIESGPALLTQLNNSRTKGQKVAADIQIEWDGVPAATVK